MRPGTAVSRCPVIPEHAISAFDQFNRDILDHKVVNESVKRLKQKCAMMKNSIRVQSARRKPNSIIPKSRMGRISSAKIFKTTKNKKVAVQKFGNKNESIINLKISM